MEQQGTGEALERPRLSEAQEDYLKQILLLSGERGVASASDLARRLGVRPASVTGMVQRLAQLGLVCHRPYRGVQLSEAGRRIALEILRHHRLLETFLAQHLGFAWDEVHEEAERLEHVISERLEQRIDERLGHPTHDPHGDPIPAPDLSMPEERDEVSLASGPVGTRGTLVRVGTQEAVVLGRLRRIGLELGTEVELVAQGEHVVAIRVAGGEREMPRSLAAMLWITNRSTEEA